MLLFRMHVLGKLLREFPWDCFLPNSTLGWLCGVGSRLLALCCRRRLRRICGIRHLRHQRGRSACRERGAGMRNLFGYRWPLGRLRSLWHRAATRNNAGLPWSGRRTGDAFFVSSSAVPGRAVAGRGDRLRLRADGSKRQQEAEHAQQAERTHQYDSLTQFGEGLTCPTSRGTTRRSAAARPRTLPTAASRVPAGPSLPRPPCLQSLRGAQV